MSLVQQFWETPLPLPAPMQVAPQEPAPQSLLPVWPGQRPATVEVPVVTIRSNATEMGVPDGRQSRDTRYGLPAVAFCTVMTSSVVQEAPALAPPTHVPASPAFVPEHAGHTAERVVRWTSPETCAVTFSSPVWMLAVPVATGSWKVVTTQAAVVPMAMGIGGVKARPAALCPPA